MLEVVVSYLLLEVLSYCRYRRRLQKARKKQLPKQRDDILLWANKHRSLIPNTERHCELENLILPTYDNYSVLTPHYKPLIFYALLRSAYLLGSGVLRLKGYRLDEMKGVRVWSKGGKDNPTVLFLHGFGFGVLPYSSVLDRLVRDGYRVMAPEFPGICYNGVKAIPSLQTYSIKLLSILPPTFSVVSNSFGSYIHSCLLLLAPERIEHQTFVEPVCFYPYFGSALNFLNLTLQGIWSQPWSKTKLIQLLSFGLVSKDLSVLEVCHRVKSEVYWDAEQHLDSKTHIILSEVDYIVESHELRRYFESRHPSVKVEMVEGSGHGEALFIYQGTK